MSVMAEKHDFSNMFMNAEVKPIPNLQAELLPCPFCGSKAERKTLTHAYGHTMYYVQCSNEKCAINPTTVAYKTKGADIRAWNTRAKERGAEE